MGYTSLAQVRSWLGVGDSIDDAEFMLAQAAAEKAIDKACRQRFEPDADVSARVFFADTWDLVRLDGSVIGDTTGMIVKSDPTADGTYDTTWSAADFVTLPLGGVGSDGSTGWPVNAIRVVGTGKYWPSSRYARPLLQITAKWGWTTTPEPVRLAATLLTASWHQRRQTLTGRGGFDGFFASAVVDDPTVSDLLAPYQARAKAVIA